MVDSWEITLMIVAMPETLRWLDSAGTKLKSTDSSVGNRSDQRTRKLYIREL